MGDRDWHELYLRGLMTQIDLERYEELVSEHAELADELASRLDNSGPWDAEMVSRGRAMLALRNTFAALLDEPRGVAITDELFCWPVEDSARGLNERTAVRLVNAVIIRAIENAVREVRISLCDDLLRIEQEGNEPAPGSALSAPRSLLPPVISRLKRVAHLDPLRLGVRQVGSLPIHWAGQNYEIGVSIEPAHDTESAVLTFSRLVA